MKIDRLLGITVYLLNHGKMTAKELSERFEVSIRTIQRDIDSLCAAGIPIRSMIGTNGGYEILNNFQMLNHVANPQDYFFIITALKGLASALGDKSVDHTVEKVVATTSYLNLDNSLSLDLSVLKEDKKIVQALKILNLAIQQKHIVRFNYTNASGKTSLPDIEPIALIYKWYSWYFLGYHSEKLEYRLYKVVMMECISETEKAFIHVHQPANHLLQQYFETDKRKYINIRLLCQSEVKMRVFEYLNGKVEKELENGDCILKDCLVLH
jgi:predicted DNA-binding transcriptional regulator YafY